jgi:hypothetical protein
MVSELRLFKVIAPEVCSGVGGRGKIRAGIEAPTRAIPMF